jgi:hypothetical protein
MSANQFGPTYPGHYPSEMRTQMWPLCCGASILSGLKNAGSLTKKELVTQITDTLQNKIPDHQIFAGETFKPAHTFLTLNQGQMSQTHLMEAIAEVGFVKIGEGRPRGTLQGFFLRDTSKTFKVCLPSTGVAAAA